MIFTLNSGALLYNDYDARGDVVGQINGSGTLVYQAEYEAFGTRPLENGSNLNRQRANTKDEDPTGLKNEGRRYLDLDTGTFLTKDPTAYDLAMGDDHWLIDGHKIDTGGNRGQSTILDRIGLAFRIGECLASAGSSMREPSITSWRGEIGASRLSRTRPIANRLSRP